jgi:DNA replication protein DnaC
MTMNVYAQMKFFWQQNETEPFPEAILLMLKHEVEYRHRTFEISDCLCAQVASIAQWLTSDDSKFGLLLCGGCGNGKTTFVKALQQLLCRLSLRDEYNQSYYGIQVQDARSIVHLMKDDYAAWNRLCRVDMLAIDDLGIEPVEVMDYGNLLCPLVDLLTKRYDLQLFTLVTTNLTPAEIRARYGDRIADRLNEMMLKIVFTNESYRSR